MTAADLLRRVRHRHGLDQRALARRAATSQAQISRIERDETSPSVETLARLVRAMGETLDLDCRPAPRSNRSTAELRADRQLSPGQRVAQAAELSHALTSIAAGTRGHEPHNR